MSDCHCDYDPPTFHSRYIHVAKKEHKCYECGGRIIVGEKYEYVSALWEGDFCVFKTCERCHDICMWVKNNVPCLCWAHGNMIDDCRETINDAHWRAPKQTVGLRFGFLRRLVNRDRLNRSRRDFR